MSEASPDPEGSPEASPAATVEEFLEKLNECTPNDEEPIINAGTVTQYANVGFAYGFTTKTVKALPPGLYEVASSQQMGWHLVAKRVVTDDLLRLPDSKSDGVVAEVKKFWALRPLFKKFGFVHKRGFLLWGPPGSGKTSTIALITKSIVEEQRGIVVIGNHPGGLTSVLQCFRHIEPGRPAVVILEDIDTTIKKYGENEVLALLDGEQAIDGVVYVATTNYPEELDGRLTNRPSRFDKVVRIGTPNAEARAIYLKSRDIPEDDVERIVDLTEGMSIAHLKEIIVSVYCLGDAMKDVVERLRKMAKAPKSSGGDGPVGFGAVRGED